MLFTGIVTASSFSEKKVKAIIVFNEDPSDDDLKYLKDNGGALKYKYSIIKGVAVELPQSVFDKMVNAAKNKKNPDGNPIYDKLNYIEVDSEVSILKKPVRPTPTPTVKPSPTVTVTPTPTATPVPPPETLPWGVNRIGADEAWPTSTGNAVKVAVLDTGIDVNHPDLQVKGGINCIVSGASYTDDHGHGTHCAGIIAAKDNEIGVVGVAPNAWLYAVKVLNSKGSGYTSDIIEGIDWSVANGMDVISMSLGSSYYSLSFDNACKNAYNNGIVIVAAAGNDGKDTISYPAAYASVIAVTATDSSDNIAYFSNYGDDAELAAPGVSIYSTYKNGGYAYMSGTSMATPHVAGVAALIIEDNPTMTAQQVRAKLQASAEDLGTSGRDNYFGYGLVDADQAVI
jgi:subtilisin family serine protease